MSSLYLARGLSAQSRVQAAQSDAEGARAEATEAWALAQSSAGYEGPVTREAAALLQPLAH